jgi:putative sigma-54 modulation protein
MNLTISYRHLESTPAIAQKIEDKASHLKKYFDGELKVDWVCAVDGNIQKSEVTVHAGQDHYHAKAEDQNLYKTLDEAISKLESQIRKKNNKSKKRMQAPKVSNAVSESSEEE